MAEKMDVLTQAFSRFLTGFCLSKAILEDYAKVVAKLENVPEGSNRPCKKKVR